MEVDISIAKLVFDNYDRMLNKYEKLKSVINKNNDYIISDIPLEVDVKNKEIIYNTKIMTYKRIGLNRYRNFYDNQGKLIYADQEKVSYPTYNECYYVYFDDKLFGYAYQLTKVGIRRRNFTLHILDNKLVVMSYVTDGFCITLGCFEYDDQKRLEYYSFFEIQRAMKIDPRGYYQVIYDDNKCTKIQLSGPYK